MVFNSLTFLVFFAAVLAVHSSPISWRKRKWSLLVASYLFYAAWNPPFVLLLWISTAVDWFAAKRMVTAATQRRRLGLLVISLVSNLGMLGLFKYGEFLLENFTMFVRMFGVAYQPPTWHIVLPVGISFYTFQTLSYTIEVYRRRMQPADSLLDFALYVSFFPQLVAGPIVRADRFLPQCLSPRRATGSQWAWGAVLLTVGLFQKTVLADGILAPVVEMVYDSTTQASCIAAWVGTIAFSSQIFFDFSGYSTCAIGAALCLGFSIPDNFRAPYASVGFSDFWRRWHISLSTWLRDYLYISLGGNRGGRFRTNVNLMVTMLLGGLWHGASWRFVVWGGLHGLYLMIERVIRHLFGTVSWTSHALVQLTLGLITYLLVCLTWVFFRACDFESAMTLISAMLGAGTRDTQVPRLDILFSMGVSALLIAGHWVMRRSTFEEVCGRIPWYVRAIALSAMLVSIVLAQEENRAFIYFQF